MTRPPPGRIQRCHRLRGAVISSVRLGSTVDAAAGPAFVIAGWRSPVGSFQMLASTLRLGVDVIGVSIAGQEFHKLPPGLDVSTGALARDVLQVIHSYGRGASVILGHGHGANVALAAASQWSLPDPPALVLIDGGYYTYNELYTADEWRESCVALKRYRYAAFDEFSSDFRSAVVEPANGRWNPAWEAMAASYVRLCDAGGFVTHVAPGADRTIVDAGYDFNAFEWGTPTVPTLLVLGEKTYAGSRRIAFSRQARRFAARGSNVEMVGVETGHYPHLDDVSAVGRSVEGFVRRRLRDDC